MNFAGKLFKPFQRFHAAAESFSAWEWVSPSSIASSCAITAGYGRKGPGEGCGVLLYIDIKQRPTAAAVPYLRVTAKQELEIQDLKTRDTIAEKAPSMPMSKKQGLKTVAALMMAATLITGIFAGEACRAENAVPEIRVGCEQDFKPYAFIDENGQPAGFSVDLIKAVADSMGISIRITPGTWDAAWNGLVAGKIDALPIVAKLPSRISQVDFSLPHTETFDAFFVRTGEPPQRHQCCEGKRDPRPAFGRRTPRIAGAEFRRKVIPVDTIAEMFSLIASGKHDALLYPKLLGTLVIKERRLRGVSAGPPIPDYKRVFSFAVKKGDAELLEKLNQGLLIVKTNGEYDRIYEKWLSVDDPWRKFQKYLVPAVTIALVVGLIVGIWLVMLQLLVRKRTRELAEKNEMLRLAGDELEERIEQRTAELSRANSGLQAEITERKRAETALRESEAKYRSLFDNMIDGFAYHRIVLDETGKPVVMFSRSTPPSNALRFKTRQHRRQERTGVAESSTIGGLDRVVRSRRVDRP
jgi:ABC-type amino acid transport substrate-binding protein